MTKLHDPFKRFRKAIDESYTRAIVQWKEDSECLSEMHLDALIQMFDEESEVINFPLYRGMKELLYGQGQHYSCTLFDSFTSDEWTAQKFGYKVIYVLRPPIRALDIDKHNLGENEYEWLVCGSYPVTHVEERDGFTYAYLQGDPGGATLIAKTASTITLWYQPDGKRWLDCGTRDHAEYAFNELCYGDASIFDDYDSAFTEAVQDGWIRVGLVGDTIYISGEDIFKKTAVVRDICRHFTDKMLAQYETTVSLYDTATDRSENTILRDVMYEKGAQNAQEVYQDTLDQGGGTWKIPTGEQYDKDTGFVVSDPSANESIELEDWTPERAKEEVEERRHNDGQWLGTWIDDEGTETKADDDVYVDVNDIYNDKDEATQKGREHKQKAIFDMSTKEEIRLDS